MTWLLDLVDDHRAAVRYDLLRHGLKLDDLGTERLTWADAIAVIRMQPPATSAVYRETRPDSYDRDRKLDRLEMLAVLMVRGQMLLGTHSDVKPDQLPTTWDDLFGPPEPQKVQVALMTLAEIDARMGWGD